MPPLLAQLIGQAILPYVVKAVTGKEVKGTCSVMEVEADGDDLVGLHAARKQPLAA